MITIDWDNYELIEAEDFSPMDLDITMEDVREALDNLRETTNVVSEKLERLLEELGDLEGELDG